MVERQAVGMGPEAETEAATNGRSLRRPLPLWVAFLAALALAVPTWVLFDALEPGPDGGGLPGRLLWPVVLCSAAFVLLALAWLASGQPFNGMRWVVAVGLMGIGFAAGMISLAFVGLATMDCNGPTTAEWHEPGLRAQYSGGKDYEDDYHRVHFLDDGSVEVRWSEGPIHLRMVVDATDFVVVTGNLDGISERVLQATIVQHFETFSLPPPAFDQFMVGRTLC